MVSHSLTTWVHHQMPVVLLWVSSQVECQAPVCPGQRGSELSFSEPSWCSGVPGVPGSLEALACHLLPVVWPSLAFFPPTRDTQDISGLWTPWRWVWLSQPKPGLTCWVLPATRWVAGLKQRTSVGPGKGLWMAPLWHHCALGWHFGMAKQKPGR